MAKLHPFLKKILFSYKERSADWASEPVVLLNAYAKAKMNQDFTDAEQAAVKAELKKMMAI